jgi:hypothetical protein
MKHEKEITLQGQHDPLPHPTDFDHRLPEDAVRWRVDRAEEKGAGEPEALERLSHEPGSEVLEVELDIR